MNLDWIHPCQGGATMLRQGRLRRAIIRGFSLVEMLVVVVIIIVLSVIMMNIYLGHGGKGAPPGKAHAPIERARDAVCSSNLTQLRAAINMEQQGEENGRFPASLQQLRGFPSESLCCP